MTSSPSPLLRLLLLAAAACATAAAGDGCSTGCDVAVAYYIITPNLNLTYIGSHFGIDDYRGLAAYNAGFPNPDSIPVGQPVLANFSCHCLALPNAPLSTYLAGSFPYRVSPRETYSGIAAIYQNLTTAAWLQATNSYPPNNDLPDGGTVNVTVNCSCGDPTVSSDLGVFLTYPLGDGETLVSAGAKFGFLLLPRGRHGSTQTLAPSGLPPSSPPPPVAARAGSRPKLRGAAMKVVAGPLLFSTVAPPTHPPNIPVLRRCGVGGRFRQIWCLGSRICRGSP